MRITQFEPWHATDLLARPTQKRISDYIADPENLARMAQTDAWSLLDGDRVLGAGGLVPYWPGFWHAWTIFASDVGGAGMLAATRATLRVLRMHPGRIEAHVDPQFQEAIRWMGVLGFEQETPKPMRKWFPDGSDALLFARVT